MSGSQKVQSAHLNRLAIVYLRQSSPRQVRENFRSTERQYGLADKAAALGWEPARILTVDADLGISGRGTHAREAYKELVGRVCLGEAAGSSAWRSPGSRETTPSFCGCLSSAP